MSRFLILEKTIFSNKIFSNIISNEFNVNNERISSHIGNPCVFHEKYEKFGSKNDFTHDDLFRFHYISDKVLVFRKIDKYLNGSFSIIMFCYVILNQKKINKNNINKILKELDKKYAPLSFGNMPNLSYYNISYNRESNVCKSSYMCISKFLNNMSLSDFQKFKLENKIEHEVKAMENYSLKLKKIIENI
jgi:hypothetical protein